MLTAHLATPPTAPFGASAARPGGLPATSPAPETPSQLHPLLLPLLRLLQLLLVLLPLLLLQLRFGCHLSRQLAQPCGG